MNTAYQRCASLSCKSDLLCLPSDRALLAFDTHLPNNVFLQVSRRLSRRLHSDLGHRKLGFVRVAVATFQELLAASAGQFARIYAKELVCEYPASLLL